MYHFGWMICIFWMQLVWLLACSMKIKIIIIKTINILINFQLRILFYLLISINIFMLEKIKLLPIYHNLLKLGCIFSNYAADNPSLHMYIDVFHIKIYTITKQPHDRPGMARVWDILHMPSAWEVGFHMVLRMINSPFSQYISIFYLIRINLSIIEDFSKEFKVLVRNM